MTKEEQEIIDGEEIVKAKKRMSKVFMKWYTEDPILLDVYCMVDKLPTKYQKTIGISTNGTSPYIRYNPYFINSLSIDALNCVLSQEGLKILLKHPTTRIHTPKNVASLASSITVAPMSMGTIKNMKIFEDFFVTPEMFKMQKSKHYEYYFEKILGNKKNIENMIKKIWDSMTDEQKKEMFSKSNDERDNKKDYQLYDGPSDAMKEYFDPNSTNNMDWKENDFFEASVQNLVDSKKGSSGAWGSITGDFMSEIIAANTPKVSPQEVLRRFGSSVMSRRTVGTRMKVNRRYGLDSPGRRRDYDTHIIFAIDISGSMSDEDLQEGLGIMNAVCGHAKITYLIFDTEIKEIVTDFRKAKNQFKIHGRGGTDFEPVIKYTDEHKVDGLVIFTDGEAFAPSKPKNTKVLWLLQSERCQKPTNWGWETHLQDN